MRLWILAILGAGCGNDSGSATDDAPAAGTPFVTVTSPRTSEAFYKTQSATVEWSVGDDGVELTCSVLATDGIASFPIALNVVVAPGAVTMESWVLSAIPIADGYRAEVSCTDDASPPLTGVGRSGAFSVTGPPQAVSYASQIQPLWTASCTSMACHDATQPQEGLNLTASVSHAELVGVASRQCPSTQLVNPGNQAQSYLMFKLQGNGPCMTGSRMPKTSPAYTPGKLQLVRDWITNGAPNN